VSVCVRKPDAAAVASLTSCAVPAGACRTAWRAARQALWNGFRACHGRYGTEGMTHHPVSIGV
jgi:hypothetical protein